MNDNNEERPVNRRQVLQTIGALGVSTPFIGDVKASTSDSRGQVEYGNLTEDAQTVFRLGLEEGRSNEYRYEKFPEQLLEYDTVVYKGDQYSLNRDYRNEARFRIAPEIVDESDLGPYDRRDLISYEKLGPDAVTAFMTGLQNGSHEQLWNYPDEFEFENRFVKYGSEYFDLNFLHEDVPIFTISPSLEEES